MLYSREAYSGNILGDDNRGNVLGDDNRTIPWRNVKMKNVSETNNFLDML